MSGCPRAVPAGKYQGVDGVYFNLRGDAGQLPELRLAMAERLLAAPNRVVYIKRGDW